MAEVQLFGHGEEVAKLTSLQCEPLPQGHK